MFPVFAYKTRFAAAFVILALAGLSAAAAFSLDGIKRSGTVTALQINSPTTNSYTIEFGTMLTNWTDLHVSERIDDVTFQYRGNSASA